MVLAMFTAGPFLKRENDKNDNSRKKRKMTKCSFAHSGKTAKKSECCYFQRSWVIWKSSENTFRIANNNLKQQQQQQHLFKNVPGKFAT
jgi:hypothetical protein